MGRSCPPRSRSEAPTGLVWESDSRSADGAPKQTVAVSMRATFPKADASLPWTFRGARGRASRGLRHSGAPRANVAFVLHP